MNYHNMVIRNPVMDVFWAGWRSTTIDLQRNGWQLAVEEDVRICRMKLALYHPTMKMYGISRVYEYEKQQMESLMGGTYRNIVMIDHVCSDIQIRHESGCVPQFCPVSAIPQYVDTSTFTSIKDMMIFRPLEAIREIVIEPTDVGTMLDRILSLQSPKQAEIREKMRKEERRNRNVVDFNQYREVYNPKTDIIAQVVTMG